MDLRQLLVVIDPTSENKQPALERAIWVAKQHSAALELFVCEHNSALDGGFFFDGPAQERARNSLVANRKKWLEELAQPLREQGFTVTCEARWGKPVSKGILQRIEEVKPDIVFREGHSHSVFQRMFMSNISWQLIRQCPVPLWLVRGDYNWKGKNICTAVDPVHQTDIKAQLDHELIKISQSFESTYQMTTQFVHTYAPISRTMLFDADLVATYDQQVNRNAQYHDECFNEIMDEFGVAKEQRHLLQGFAEDIIPAFVKEHKTDLLIMGAVSRSNFEAHLIGYTAERILESTDCDLLVARPR